MEKGDPKQLAVMAVLAVGAVGFLVTQLGGKAAPAVAKALATTSAPGAAPASGMRLAALTSDPFSHRKLASPSANPLGAPTTATPLGKQAPLSGAIAFKMPALPPIGSFGSASGGPLLPSTIGAAKLAPKTSASEKPKEAASTEVALEAIAGASDTVAFLSVGGGESQPYRPNDRIRGGVRLLRVNDGAVVLSGPQGELTLEVGERKRI